MMPKSKLDKNIFYQQYKQMCDSAEMITTKRQNLNNFYLAINSLFVSSIGYLATGKSYFGGFLVGFISILISVIWFFHIRSYKKLNNAKFKIILELEEKLPVKLYGWENDLLKKDYYKLTSLEKFIPLVFGLTSIFFLTYLVYTLL